MAWQLTIDNAQLTIDNSKNYDFSIFNSQLSTQTIVNSKYIVTVTVVTVIFRRVVYKESTRQL